MNRFLQQQPYGLDSPGSSSGGNRTHSMDYTALMAERQGGGVVMAGARAARRGSTDLVGECGCRVGDPRKCMQCRKHHGVPWKANKCWLQ